MWRVFQTRTTTRSVSCLKPFESIRCMSSQSGKDFDPDEDDQQERQEQPSSRKKVLLADVETEDKKAIWDALMSLRQQSRKRKTVSIDHDLDRPDLNHPYAWPVDLYSQFFSKVKIDTVKEWKLEYKKLIRLEQRIYIVKKFGIFFYVFVALMFANLVERLMYGKYKMGECFEQSLEQVLDPNDLSEDDLNKMVYVSGPLKSRHPAIDDELNVGKEQKAVRLKRKVFMFQYEEKLVKELRDGEQVDRYRYYPGWFPFFQTHNNAKIPLSRKSPETSPLELGVKTYDSSESFVGKIKISQDAINSLENWSPVNFKNSEAVYGMSFKPVAKGERLSNSQDYAKPKAGDLAVIYRAVFPHTCCAIGQIERNAENGSFSFVKGVWEAKEMRDLEAANERGGLKPKHFLVAEDMLNKLELYLLNGYGRHMRDAKYLASEQSKSDAVKQFVETNYEAPLFSHVSRAISYVFPSYDREWTPVVMRAISLRMLYVSLSNMHAYWRLNKYKVVGIRIFFKRFGVFGMAASALALHWNTPEVEDWQKPPKIRKINEKIVDPYFMPVINYVQTKVFKVVDYFKDQGQKLPERYSELEELTAKVLESGDKIRKKMSWESSSSDADMLKESEQKKD